MTVGTDRSDVVEVVVGRIFVDVVELNKRRLANAASVVGPAQDLVLEVFRNCDACSHWVTPGRGGADALVLHPIFDDGGRHRGK